MILAVHAPFRTRGSSIRSRGFAVAVMEMRPCERRGGVSSVVTAVVKLKSRAVANALPAESRAAVVIVAV